MTDKKTILSSLGASLGAVVSYSFLKEAIAAEKNSNEQYLRAGAGIIFSTLALVNLNRLFSKPEKEEKTWVQRTEQPELEHKDVRSL